jgi:hypothetical protein
LSPTTKDQCRRWHKGRNNEAIDVERFIRALNNPPVLVARNSAGILTALHRETAGRAYELRSTADLSHSNCLVLTDLGVIIS